MDTHFLRIERVEKLIAKLFERNQYLETDNMNQ